MSVRLTISYFFAAAGISFTSWTVRMPYLQTVLHINKLEWGFILLCPVFSSLASALLANYLISRYLNRKILLSGVWLVSISLIAIGWADNKLSLAVGLLIFGSGMGLFNIAMNDQACALERQYQRSIMASFHGVFSLGGMLGALIGSLSAQLALPPNYHLTLVALLIVIGGSFCYRSLLTSTSDMLLPTKPISLITLPQGRLWLVGSIAIASVFIEGAMSDWSSLYLKNMQATESLAALGLAAFSAAMAIGRLVGDKVINQLGHITTLQIAAWLTIAGLLLALWLTDPSLVIVGFVITGLGMSIIFPCLLSLATKLKNTDMTISAAISAVSMMGYLALLAGPPSIGLIAHLIGLHYSFVLLLISGIIILILIYSPKLSKPIH